MAEEVTIRLQGHPESAIRAIEEVRAALATLQNQTVRVRVEQDKATASSKRAEAALGDQADAEKELGKQTVARLASQLKASDLEQRVAVTRLKAAKATEGEAQSIIHENEAMARGRVLRQRVFEDLQKDIKARSANARSLEQGATRIRSVDDGLIASQKRNDEAWKRVWEGRAQTVERASRRMARAQSGGGRRGGAIGGIGSLGKSLTSNFAGLDFGRGGVAPRTVGMGLGVAGVAGMIGPLTDLLGLVGAIPAALGAAGLAFAAFKSIGAAALNKTVADQQKATEKFKAGTIDAKAYHKAMTNALVGLSKEQRAALPFFYQWHDIVLKTAEAMRSKMLPALGALGAGLKANKGAIVGAFGGGAGIVGNGISQAGGFLASREGRAGVGALASSSQNMLAGFTRAGVNGIQALLSVVKAARPLVNSLSEDITRMSARFAAWTSSFRGQQTMKAWFERAHTAATQFAHVLANVSSMVASIGRGIGGGMLSGFDDLTKRASDYLKTAEGQQKIAHYWGEAVKFASMLARIVQNLAPSIAATAQGLAKIVGFLTTKVPGGADTVGTIFAANMLTKGIAGKVVGKAGGGLLGKVGGGAAGGAAAGGAAAGGGGLAAGGAAGAASFAAMAASVAAIGVGIAYAVFVAKNLRDHGNDVSKAWDRVTAATQRTRASMASVAAANSAQRSRVSTAASLTAQVPSARLALFDAKDRLAADKAALPGLGGKERERMKIQIDVDTQAVKDAREQLRQLRAAVTAAGTAANRHADDSREAGRAAAGAASQEKQALEAVTDAAAKHNAAISRTGPGLAKAQAETASFAAAMRGQAAALKGSDRAASTYASTAARLAGQLHRIPTSVEVNIAVAADQALYSLKSVASLLASIKDKNVRLTVTQAVGSINPIGRPAPGANPPKRGSHGMAGMKITTPTAIVGEQAPTHPEYVIATNPQYRERNKGLVTQAAQALGGQVQFYAQGGVMGGWGGSPWGGFGIKPPPAPPAPAPPKRNPLAGIQSALQAGSAYMNINGTQAGIEAAAKYAAIPSRMKILRKEIRVLNRQVERDDSYLLHEKDVLLELRRKQRAEKDRKKKERIRQQIEDITVNVVPRRKRIRAGRNASIKSKSQTIDDLTSQLGVVPGSEAFSNLVAILEGEQIAAGEVGRPDMAVQLKQREVLDYQQRIKFLLGFTNQKSTWSNKDLWAAASAELAGRKGELSSLTETPDDSNSGGGGSGSDSGGAVDNGDKDQALAMLAELAQFARQGRLSDLIGDSELALAMQFIGQQVGSFAKGTPFIKKSGMAAVHYGERIVPAHENTGSGGSSSLTGELVLVGSDALTKALADALGPRINVTMGREARRMAREGVR